MTTTIAPAAPSAPSAPSAPTAPAPATRRRWFDERRIAGIGALTFASLVLLTNVLQGATPAMDASADEITTYLTDHRNESLFATGAFAVGSLFLLAFASAFYGRLKALGRPEDLVWARFGMIGALLILPTFATVVVHRIVLLVGGDEIINSPELVTLVWRFEMAAFAINALPISAAVLGFGIAGSRAGLLPAWYRKWAPIGAVAGIVTAACAVAGLEGSPIGFGGIVPFLSWMLLLLIAGVRQLRSA